MHYINIIFENGLKFSLVKLLMMNYCPFISPVGLVQYLGDVSQPDEVGILVRLSDLINHFQSLLQLLDSMLRITRHKSESEPYSQRGLLASGTISRI